jgi:hypothetical protein
MNDRFVNTLIFWFLAIIPFCGLFMILNIYGSFWFSAFLLIYALIYRPLLHIGRLLNLKKIEEKDAWKFFIPFYGSKYIKTLWFG